MATIHSQTSNASAISSGVGDDANKVKLRLCYNGRFEQTPSHTWRFLGGEYFNESVGYGVKYADFMFKLSEKFKTAVSVKYQAPGEELDPETLISVQDDADLQELVEDYFAHLERPGTPSKTFRIKVFVFMAAEEPLTPDEIMEGQSFFSEARHALPSRVRTAFRGLDGRSSWGSTLSSTGTPCTRAQDVSSGDWLSSVAGPTAGVLAGPCDLPSELHLQQLVLAAAGSQAGGQKRGGSGSSQQQQQLLLHHPHPHHHHAIDAAMEQEALDRVRLSVSCHQGLHPSLQRQLLLRGAPGEAGEAALGWGAEGEGEEEEEDEDEEGLAGVLGEEEEEEEDDDLGDAEDDEQIAEVIAAISEQQAAAAAAAEAAAAAAAAVVNTPPGSCAASLLAPGPDARLPDDPWDASDDSCAAAEARGLPALPSHISAFGEGSTEEEEDEDEGEQDGRGLGGRVGPAAGDAVLGALAAAAAAAGLPSHISAFGDDLSGQVPGVCAGLADSEGTEGEVPANGAGALGEGAPARLGHGPRTQDSRFSLDGDAAGGGSGGGAGRPDRQDSGDSLRSLPKLQPVHRLAKPDLRTLTKIGEGAFGEVSVASAPLYGTVAVKWLKSERFGKHFASFGREAALLADLNHPNVLRFYGVVTESANDPTVIGIMTEYIRGGSLSSFLRMSRSLLPLRTRCELALAASNGLAYLHELSIVHFDLKPDNLLLDAPPAVVRAAAGAGLDGDDDVIIRLGSAAGAGGGAGAGAGAASPRGAAPGRSGWGPPAAAPAAPGGAALEVAAEVPVVKVADFGLSKHKLNSTYVSSCRDLRGTLPYMAPELVADPERVSEKADVWSLGVVMWEMLTRQIPFQDLAPQQILMGLMCGNLHLDVPEWCEPEWRGLLEACLEPNPCNRPSMRELARQLEAIRDQQLAQEQPAAAAAPTAMEQPLRRPAEPSSADQQQQRLPAVPQEPEGRPLSPSGAHFDGLASVPAPAALLQRQQQQQHQLVDASLSQQQQHLQVAHEDLQQQVAEQAQRMMWLENAMVQQQAHQQLQQSWLSQQALQLQQAHAVAEHAAAAAAAAAAVPPASLPPVMASGLQQHQHQQHVSAVSPAGP